MFVKKLFLHISSVRISKRKRKFNVKSSTYYFDVKTNILADIQICITVPLTPSGLQKGAQMAIIV